MRDEAVPIHRNDHDYINHLEAQVTQFQRQLDDITDELANERTQHRRLKRKYDDLASDYDRLKMDYNSAVKKNVGHDDIAERFRRLEEAVFAGKTDLIARNSEPSTSGSKEPFTSGSKEPSTSKSKEPSTSGSKDPPIQRQFFVQQPSKPSRNDKQSSSAPQQSSYPSSEDLRRSNQPRDRPEDRTKERSPRRYNQTKERPEDSSRPKSRHNDSSRSRRDEPNWSRNERDDSRRQRDDHDNSRNRNRSHQNKPARYDSRQQSDPDRVPTHPRDTAQNSRWNNAANQVPRYQNATNCTSNRQNAADQAPQPQNTTNPTLQQQNAADPLPKHQTKTDQASQPQSATDPVLQQQNAIIQMPKQENTMDWTSEHQINANQTPKQQDQTPQSKNSSKKRDRQHTKPSIVPSSASTNPNCGTYPGLTPMSRPVKAELQYLPWHQDSIPSLMSTPVALPTTNSAENLPTLSSTNIVQYQMSPNVNNPKTPRRNSSSLATPAANAPDPTNLNARRMSNKTPKVPDENRKPRKEAAETKEEISLIEQQQLARMIHVGPPLGMAAFVEDKDCEVNQSSKVKRRIAHQKSLSVEPPAKITAPPSKTKPIPPKKDQPPSVCSSDDEEWEPSEIQFFRDFIARLNEAKNSESRQKVIDDMRRSGKLPRFLQFKRRYISEHRS